MNYNYFVKRQIQSHKLLFAIAVLQMSIVIYLIIVLFSNFEGMNYATGLFKGMDSENYVYIARTVNDIFEKDRENEKIFDEFDMIKTRNIEAGMSFHEASEAAWNELGNPNTNARSIEKDELSDIPNIKNIWYMGEAPVGCHLEGEFESILTIDRNFAEKLNYSIKEGKWLIDSRSDGNIIDAVAANNTKYKLGDIVPVENYEYIDGKSEAVDTGYKIRVIGILDYGEAEVCLSDSCSWLDSLSLYDLIGSFEDNTFLVLNEDISSCLESYGYDDRSLSHNYLFAEINFGKEQLKETEEKLAENRMTMVSLKRLYSNTVDLQRNKFSDSVIPTLAASIFSIFVMISVSVFQMQYMAKKYKIFYICGMEKGKEKTIHILYIIRVIATAMILALGVYAASGLWNYKKAIDSMLDQGFSLENAAAWYSIGDFIQISPVSVPVIAALSLTIILLSTVLSSHTIKYRKDS